ncbi:MAG: hypothetical protein ACTSQS_09125 [Promethearchaeota archaeon]
MITQKKSVLSKIFEPFNEMGLIAKLIFIGGILMSINAYFDFFSAPYGGITFIFSIFIVIFASQVSDENPNCMFYTIFILLLNFFNHAIFHQYAGIPWHTESKINGLYFPGLGYIGYIIINLAASLALVLLILRITLLKENGKYKIAGLYFFGIFLIGINLYIYLIFVNFVLTTESMLAILYFSLIIIFTILALFGHEVIPNLIISLIIFLNQFGIAFSTPITGFNVGTTLVGLIALNTFLDRFGKKLK